MNAYLFGCGLVTLLAFFFSTPLWSVVVLFLFIVISLVNYQASILFYILLMPIWSTLGSVSISLSVSIIFIFFFLLNVTFKKERISNLNLNFFILMMIVVFFALLGTLTSSYYEYIHVLLLLIIALFVSFIIQNYIIKNPKFLYFILVAFVISGVIALVVSLYKSGGEFRRLSLGGLTRADGGNVRQLANVLGFALVIALAPLKTIISRNGQSNIIASFSYWIVVAFLTLGLLLTSSRGVMLSVVLALSLYYFFEVTYRKKLNLKHLLLGIIGLSLVYGFIVYFSDVFELQSSLLLLEERFDDDAIEGGMESRFQIWRAGLSSMSFAQVLFGHGLSSFRFLALQNGVDYYSHSFFVGAFTDIGIVGFSAILYFIIHTFYLIKKSKTFSALPVLLYAIISHSTHGSLTSGYFWLALAYGMAAASSKEQKVNS